MIVILVRIVICLALFCSPILLYILASRKQENALWLVIPLFGAIPAILGALFVFVPLEIFLDAQSLDHRKNVAVPLSGALLIVIFMVLAAAVSGNLWKLLQRFGTDKLQVIGPVVFWSILGVIWGGFWRLSDWLVGLVFT